MRPRQRDWLTRRTLNELLRRDRALHQAATELLSRTQDPTIQSVLKAVAETTWYSGGLLQAELSTPPGSSPARAGRVLTEAARVATRLGEGTALWIQRWALASQLRRLHEALKRVDGPAHALIRQRLIPAHAYALSLLRTQRSSGQRAARLP